MADLAEGAAGHPTIAGIIVHPSGWNVVLRDGSTIWLDCTATWKASLIHRAIVGEAWGDFITTDTDTERYVHGFPVQSYRDAESGNRAVWGRVRRA